MNKYPDHKYQGWRQTGFSLFEVIIAVVITAVGLLGLAAMQTVGLKNNNTAYRRSQATVLVYDIADRMRANTASIGNYVTTLTADSGTEAQAGCRHTGGCSSTRMVLNDLHEWKTAMSASLPGPIGTIAFDAGSNVYTIDLSWAELRNDTVDAFRPHVQISFQPIEPLP